MKPFAGRPMIECNDCGTWIHLSCAKIKRSQIPEFYSCIRCKKGRRSFRNSSPRTGPLKTHMPITHNRIRTNSGSHDT